MHVFRRPRWVAAGMGLSLWLIGSCTDPIAPNDFAGNFETLWSDFDRTYPFFIVKGIDWDAHRRELAPRAATAHDERELFSVVSDLLLHLEDGHVRLSSSFGSVQYSGWYDRFPANYDPDIVRTGHLIGSMRTAPNGTMSYGLVEDDIGYVHVPSLGGNGHGADLEAVLSTLPDLAGLIVDIRDNGGGNDQNGRAIAARFADRRRLFRRIQYRDGAGHGEFTFPEDDHIEPGGSTRFEAPVALLTNRRVFSSAESFVLAMRVIPSVTVVGDTTGGGSANPAQRTLPIGWTYTVSRWLVTTPEGGTFEGIGLVPDVPMALGPDDPVRNRDSIVEAAVAVIRDGAAPIS